MKTFLLLFIIIAFHDFLYLVPDATLTYLAPDIGLIVLFGLLFYQIFLEKHDLRKLNNFFSWYIFLYLCLVVVQASIASYYYEQSVIDGLIVARGQFKYLIGFSFMLYFQTNRDIERFMMAMSIMALIVLYLGLVNYLGPTIFQHRWAEGHGMRSGILRAFLPAMEVFVMVLIWHLCRLLDAKRLLRSSLMFVGIAAFALLFRQTKMHIVASFTVCAIIMVYHKRFGMLMTLAGVLFMGSLIVSLYTKQNIIVNMFENTYEAVMDSGTNRHGDERTTWDARMEQIVASKDTVMETFFTGSGGLVLRESEEALSSKLHAIRRGMDLGYFVWVKYYGLPGVLLLLSFVIYGIVFRIKSRVRKNSPYAYIDNYAFYHLVVIIISMVTITYLTTPHTIPIFCICMSIMVTRAKMSKAQESLALARA